MLADDGVDTVVVTVTIGGVALVTIVGIWLKWRSDKRKRNGGEKP